MVWEERYKLLIETWHQAVKAAIPRQNLPQLSESCVFLSFNCIYFHIEKRAHFSVLFSLAMPPRKGGRVCLWCIFLLTLFWTVAASARIVYASTSVMPDLAQLNWNLEAVACFFYIWCDNIYFSYYVLFSFISKFYVPLWNWLTLYWGWGMAWLGSAAIPFGPVLV